ncbi:MAG: FAD-dependent oxidoreductase [Pseudomonadota bacterium]|nr:FAD-dependent oxidoreductase [Pseudomonadota bacterium]
MIPAAARTTFDAIVVGAGPAGSTVAIQLARAGWSVALIERQHFPRRKVCGECIAASNLPMLAALGIGDAIDALAGPTLRQVTLLRGDSAVTADLPAADHDRYPWGRALGRETLDSLLLEQAQAAGALVFQPCAVQAILGTAGAWFCEVRALESAALLRLRATVVVDAHGSWEDLPSDRLKRRLARNAADLFAFKANFSGSALRGGQISVLALDGGYGGMVVADGGMTTLACCIRRDRLNELRGCAPVLRASDAVEAWLQRECAGVRQALQGALRDGPWLASGPLDPGIRRDARDGIFRVGNAAGEAHPILGEGMSMALQSAALLCSHLLGYHGPSAAPDGAAQAALQQGYLAAWRCAFAPRLRLAAVFAHLAMRPRSAAALMKLVQAWPGLLTQGARWGGKVRIATLTETAVPAHALAPRPASAAAPQAH